MLTKLQIMKNYTGNDKVVREKVATKDLQNIHSQNKITWLDKKTDAANKDEEVAVRESAGEHVKAVFTEFESYWNTKNRTHYWSQLMELLPHFEYSCWTPPLMDRRQDPKQPKLNLWGRGGFVQKKVL